VNKISAKNLIFRVFLTVLLLLAAACSRKEEVQKGNIPVVAVGSQWYGHIPVWVGIQRGTFEKHGFEVSWRFIGKSMDRLNAISSGDAQFASLGQVAMLSAMAQGNNRFYWVGNQDIAPGFEGLVAQPGITSFEQLRGRKVGLPFGSSVDLTARMLLKDHGLDPDKDVQLVNLEVGDVPAVFRAGNVDAAIIWEPGFSQLKEVEGATVLGMDTDTPVYKKFGTMTGPDVLILGKSWCDENPGRARRFLTAYFESLQWVKNNPDSAAQVVHEKYIVQDVDLIRQNLSRFVWQTLEDQKQVMSDEGIFGQTEYILKILHEEMKAIPLKPEFRKWVPMHILPFSETSQDKPPET
jgi:ABC-type nitrate/sulfonate/bicarbonate transport system substrate-binding protein